MNAPYGRDPPLIGGEALVRGLFLEKRRNELDLCTGWRIYTARGAERPPEIFVGLSCSWSNSHRKRALARCILTRGASMSTIYLDETDDPINICYDNVFKAVFTRNTPESQIALSRLVSAITSRTLTVLSITNRRYTSSGTGRSASTYPVKPRTATWSTSKCP
jgi:hypothetical protein